MYFYSLELAIEGFDDARNYIRDVRKRSDDWKSFYGVAPITEAYARGEIEIHLYFMCSLDFHAFDVQNEHAFTRQRANVSNYCIRMYRHPYLEFGATTNNAGEAHTSDRDSQNGNQAMLVGIVQFVKQKKGTVPITIPSLVWLKCLDACPETPIDALKKTQTISLTPELMDRVTFPVSPFSLPDKIYGESGVVIGLGVAQERKLPSQKVERRAEIVGNLPNEQTPLKREVRGTALNAEMIMPGFSVELGNDNSVRILFEDPLKGHLQGCELALCPLYLSSWPIQRMHMLYYPFPKGEAADKSVPPFFKT